MGLLINHSLHYEKCPDGTVKCIEDEIPFELPEGWEWTRIRNISTVKGGKRLPKGMSFSESPTNHAYIRVTDMKNNTIITSDLRFIADDVYEKIKNYIISKEDLYVTIAGTIGVVGEVPDELDGMNLTENAVKITDITINKTFLCLLIQSDFVQQQFIDKTHQVAMPKLALERILSTLIPICSISEQSSIVSRFNALSVLVNDIQQNNQELIDTISLTKSKILDLAIRGKLVPQNPDDEPASVLLDRIRAEKEELIKQGKIKRDKKESVIYKGDDNSYYEAIGKDTENIDDDIPYDIPDGWAWCRIKDICQMNAGKSKPKDQIFPEPFNNCFPCYGGNGHRGYVDTYNYEGKYSIVGRQGALCGNVNTAEGKFYATEHAVVVTLFDKVNFEWSFFTLKTLNLNQYATGAAQPGLSVANIQNVFIPVPPLSEQKRIADKVSQLFSLLDSIAENVN